MYYIFALSHACTLELNVVFLLTALTLYTTIFALFNYAVNVVYCCNCLTFLPVYYPAPATININILEGN